MRKSNIELLRIISMILIVMHHYASHGNFPFVQTLTINKYIMQILIYGGKLGVNIFVLISAYFLTNNKINKLTSKIIKTIAKTTIYSIIILVIFLILGKTINMIDIVYSILPIIYSTYWFITAYLLMLVFSNFINKFVYSLEKREYQKLLIITTVIGTIIPTFFYTTLGLSSLFWFIYLYLIAAYIKIYDPKIFKNKNFILYGVILYILCLLSCLIFDIIGEHILIFANAALYFANMTRATMLLTALFIFVGFKNLNIKDSKIINNIAAATLGVYLIHDNFLIRKVLWTNILKSNQYYKSPYFILHAVISIIMVYVICTLIDMIYNKIVGKRIDKTIDNLCEKNNIFIKLLEKSN